MHQGEHDAESSEGLSGRAKFCAPERDLWRGLEGLGLLAVVAVDIVRPKFSTGRVQPCQHLQGMASEDGAERQISEVSEETLREVIRRILGVCSPDRVILFGSAATGRMTRDSDIDLLVLDSGLVDRRKEALLIRRALSGLPFPFDIVVMSKDRFDETRNVIGGIAWPAARDGKVIFEAA